MEFQIGTVVRISKNHLTEANQVGMISGYDKETNCYSVKLRYGEPPISVRPEDLHSLSGAKTVDCLCEADLFKPSLTVEDLKKGVIKTIPSEKEAVNHPNHYQGPHECIEVMEALFGREAVKNFCRCNAFKYRFRAEAKNGAEDIRKAQWYEEYLIKMGGIDNGMQEVR